MITDVAALMKITDRPPVVMVEGHGSWLRDEEGKPYLDFVLAVDAQIDGFRATGGRRPASPAVATQGPSNSYFEGPCTY